MRVAPFTRPTLLAAVELLELHSQARFNQAVLRLGLEDEVPQGTDLSVGKKCAILGRAILQRSNNILDTLDGSMTLAEAVVREAAQLAHSASTNAACAAFLLGLARDGFVLVPGDQGGGASIRAALPNEIQLPQTDDEVHHLLKHFRFNTPLGHLDQAIDAHARGDWAACNSQLRTFLEGLLDDIARIVRPQEAAQLPTSENRRALLTDAGFLAADRNEWTRDGKGYLNGLFKMLHTQGSHPGLSDEDHSTFRLHAVLVTAGMLLRRLYRQN
ncbi:hypothetical protein ISP17_13400 [Dyella ginsengisoli]|uniref:TIGR02391 family protein n=1 Tax=Dyella ginsengisoli TaxID=363848 RepID=A0ABW8JUX7_9GAMM